MAKLDRDNGEPILFLCDEDLEMTDAIPDASKVSDEKFRRIVDKLKDHYNECFIDTLADIIDQVEKEWDEE